MITPNYSKASLVKAIFKSVGQGDSIILEWENSGIKKIGIIDCNIYDNYNPIVDYLKINSTPEIEFIVLTHLHIDHFSGMAELFEYCMTNNIPVNYFYHSLDSFIGEILNKILLTKKIEKAVKDFWHQYSLFYGYVKDSIQINKHLAPINLNSTDSFSFLSPEASLYTKMAIQLARKRNIMPTSSADINKLAPIMLIKTTIQAFLLCSDAVRKSFKSLKNINAPEVQFIQIPHHGSWWNIYEPFWINLNRISDCPAVFSVGEQPKDKLPNFKTVSFFDTNKYKIYSTDAVYGIREFLGLPLLTTASAKKQSALNQFSKVKKNYNFINKADYIGDQSFSIL